MVKFRIKQLLSETIKPSIKSDFGVSNIPTPNIKGGRKFMDIMQDDIKIGEIEYGQIDSNTYEIVSIYVDKQYRRKGIGATTYQEFKKHLNNPKIILKAAPSSVPFWKSVGFKKLKDDYYINESLDDFGNMIVQQVYAVSKSESQHECLTLNEIKTIFGPSSSHIRFNDRKGQSTTFEFNRYDDNNKPIYTFVEIKPPPHNKCENKYYVTTTTETVMKPMSLQSLSDVYKLTDNEFSRLVDRKWLSIDRKGFSLDIQYDPHMDETLNESDDMLDKFKYPVWEYKFINNAEGFDMNDFATLTTYQIAKQYNLNIDDVINGISGKINPQFDIPNGFIEIEINPNVTESINEVDIKKYLRNAALGLTLTGLPMKGQNSTIPQQQNVNQNQTQQVQEPKVKDSTKNVDYHSNQKKIQKQTRIRNFMSKFLPAAKASEQQTGVPALVTLAQAALESGWGKSSPGNNFFGIKANRNWKGDSQLLTTTEFSPEGAKYPEVLSVEPTNQNDKRGRKLFKYRVKDYFRSYDSPEQSFTDRGNFFKQNPRYSNAFQYNDPYEFASAIAQAGYATDPNYANKLHQLIDLFQNVMPVTSLNNAQPDRINESDDMADQILFKCTLYVYSEDEGDFVYFEKQRLNARQIAAKFNLDYNSLIKDIFYLNPNEESRYEVHEFYTESYIVIQPIN